MRGLVLAAGAGRRMGGPKALVRPRAGGPTLVEQAVTTLLDGGCDGVTVVVGSAAPEVRAIVDSMGRDVEVVDCLDWDEGMGASLRSGLTVLSGRVSGVPTGSASPGRTAGGTAVSGARSAGASPGVEAALVTLVDLPDLPAEVVARLIGRGVRHGAGDGAGTWQPDQSVFVSAGPRAPSSLVSVLRRAAYDGVPGHPALIGREHWVGVRATAVGDRGARDYYRLHPHELVECGDLATGRDVDTPEDLEPTP